MGSARLGGTSNTRPPPIASKQLARERLRSLQAKIGRTPEDAAAVEQIVGEFVAAIRDRTALLLDARFARFQERMTAALDSLAAFSEHELVQVLGTDHDDIGNMIEFGDTFITPEGRGELAARARAQADEQSPVIRQMSLGAAKRQLDLLHRFFVRVTPQASWNNLWLPSFVALESAVGRNAIARHDPRPALARYLAAHAREVSPPVSPSELMFLSLLAEMPGEECDSARQAL
jgi:hypothetical protein